MHSNKVSIIIALVIIAISIFLLMIYFGKQGKYTFAFIGELYKEIKTEKNKVGTTPENVSKAFAYVVIDAMTFGNNDRNPVITGILTDVLLVIPEVPINARQCWENQLRIR